MALRNCSACFLLEPPENLNPRDFDSTQISLSVEYFALLNSQRMQSLTGRRPKQINELPFESTSSIEKITLSTISILRDDFINQISALPLPQATEIPDCVPTGTLLLHGAVYDVPGRGQIDRGRPLASPVALH
jgi:hypothetical protein